jgi:hypothetical protein
MELLELSILYAIKTMDGQESDDAAGVNEIEGMLIQERRTGRVQLDERTRYTQQSEPMILQGYSYTVLDIPIRSSKVPMHMHMHMHACGKA